MITMKFGGTSVGDVQRLQEVVSIVQAHLASRPVLVASAMSGVTNLLLDTAQLAAQRETDRVSANISLLKNKHRETINFLIKDPERKKDLIENHSRIFEELSNLYHGVSLLKELSIRSLDVIASFGEILSCMQIAAILRDNNIPAEFIDSRPLIRTDAHFGEASVDFTVTNINIKEYLLPRLNKNIVPVVTGFIASTEDGLTTTLGRSGSDYTGSIVGAALGSEEIWIWTDVDGVMTADPRFVKGAKVLPQISYREAAEMSYFGAKVIHPKTMVPAIETGIPIRIKNTFNPSHPGTIISNTADTNGTIVKTVTSIDDLSLVAVEGNGMIGAPGISARIFSALARVQVNVMMISQASSEHNVCMAIPQRDCNKAVAALRAEFESDISRKAIDDIKVQDPVSIVAVVGEGMRGMRGVAGKTFSAVAAADISIVAIAQGSSELNISLVVEQAEAHKAVQAIHDAFHLA
jgi:bifunctional aspartokinase / homoserine dehydrogenase 1